MGGTIRLTPPTELPSQTQQSTKRAAPRMVSRLIPYKRGAVERFLTRSLFVQTL